MKVIKKYKIAKLLLVALFSFATITILSAPVSAAEPSAKRIFNRYLYSDDKKLEDAYDLIQTKDDGWLAVGATNVTVGPMKARMVKYTSAGVHEYTFTSSLSTAYEFTSVSESQDGGTYFATSINFGGGTVYGIDDSSVIHKFSKTGNNYTESTWETPNHITVDGEYYNAIDITNFVLDDDGKYVIYGVATHFAGEHVAPDKQIAFALKVSDLPTCTLGDDLSCADAIWSFYQEVDDASEASMALSLFAKTAAGEYVALISTSIGYNKSTIIKIKESADGLSVTTEWVADLGSVGGATRIFALGNDEFILARGLDGMIAKIAVTKDSTTGEASVEQQWRSQVHVGTQNYANGNTGIDDVAVMSDGSVLALYTLSTEAPEQATINKLARYGNIHAVTKISNTGETVYTIRPSNESSSSSEITVNRNGSYTVVSSTSIQEYMDTNIYDINYHVNQADKPAGYEEYETEQVWNNTNADLTITQYDGWSFDGWYEDSNLSGTKRNKKIITADTDLYAKYEKKTYTANFTLYFYDDQGNYIKTETLDPVPVEYGTLNYQRECPTQEAGYTYDCWYDNSNLSGEKVDFSNPDSILPSDSGSSKTFYARVTQATYLVNFHITSTDNPDYYLNTQVRVRHGETVADPELPSKKQGYKFNGWYTNYNAQTGALTNPYNFNTPVTGGLDLYAEWIDSVLRIDGDGIHYPGGVIDGTAIYDEETHTLTLDDYDGGPIEITGIDDDFTIIIEGDNVIGADGPVGDYGIYSDGPLHIEGDGSLSIDATGDNWVYCIVDVRGDLTIDSGTINITDNMTQDGTNAICANGDININGGDIDISSQGYGITSNKDGGNINLNGGQIDISSGTDGLRIYNGVINFNGAEVNLARNDTEEGKPCTSDVAEARYIKIDKGTLNTECNISADVIVINGGTSNVAGIDSRLFNQNGGKVNISNTGTGMGNDIAALSTGLAVFNGGTMEIDNTTMGILSYGAEYSEEFKNELAEKAKEIGGVMPKDTFVEFNGGDTSINADILPIVVLSLSATEDLDAQVLLSENMLKDPDYATLTQVEFMGEYLTIFSDGKGDVEINMDPSTGAITATHAVKKIRIYEKIIPPVPHTNDEENPNTVDFQILGLAGAVFVAVMFQGMIIADLYRRLHGYEEEIAAEAAGGNTMINNESAAQTQPEEKPAEEVAVKFEKHDSTNDYDGPGDEYYY